jgi:hypothetical protein
MQTIYKYPLVVEDVQELVLPFRSTILCVKVQDNLPVLYAIVNTQETEESTCYIYTIGTGNKMYSVENYKKYIGTYELDGGAFVGHVFWQ